MTDKEIRQKILVYLHNIFKTDPTSFKSTDEIGTALGILHIESKRAIVYLHQKGWIDQYQDEHHKWYQKINANGIDELEKLESEVKPIIFDIDNKTIRINILEYLKYHYGKEFGGEPELHDLILDLDLTNEDAIANLRYMEEKGWVESFTGQSDTSYQLTTKGMDALDRLTSKDSNVTPPSKKLKNNLISDKIKSIEQTTHDRISSRLHDFFICHATEDKEVVARPLAKKLDELGLDVWYDEFSLRWGSKLMKTITKGIRESKFGIVILSPKFFEKTWAQLELDALVVMLKVDDGELLPLLYNLTHEQVKEKLPLLSGILYRTWDEGLDQLAAELKHIADGNTEGFRKMNVMETKSVSKLKSHEFDLTLDKYTENGNHYVGIRNARGRTVKSCSILCEYEKCKWWDAQDDSSPRHIYENGGANALLPRGFANTNPMIRVESEGTIIEEIHLSKIVRRPSSKWIAEDENEEKVERLKSAINTIRSDLASLQSIFQFLLTQKKDIPITDEIRINLDQKDWIVERLRTTVNQTAYLLDTNWTERINEICMLVKKHPVILPAYRNLIQTMNCMSCSGIVSQIVEVLKIMPNPPI